MSPQNKGLIDNSSFIEINFEMQRIEYSANIYLIIC